MSAPPQTAAMALETKRLEGPSHVRWRSGMGCLLPVIVAAALLFAWLAVDADAVHAGHGRRDATMRMLESLRHGGVNVPFLLIALALVYELAKIGWRWADEVAVAATDAGLRFHPTLLRRPLAWEEIGEVRFVSLRRQWADVPSLLVAPRDGRSFTVSAVENGAGEAERFAALASETAADALDDNGDSH